MSEFELELKGSSRRGMQKQQNMTLIPTGLGRNLIGTETQGTIQKSRDTSRIQGQEATHLLISTDVRTESPEY